MMKIEQIAQIAHEANTALCKVLGDPPLPHWDELTEEYRQSSIKGVQHALEGATPEQLHESWLEERKSQGWVYGTVLDRERKVHPNLIAYHHLPESQRRKDDLFLAVVRACCK